MRESTPFIEFMLGVILDAVRKACNKVGNRVGNRVGNKVGNKVGNTLTDIQLKVIENIKLNSKISAVKLSEKIGISKRKIEENLAKLKELNILNRVGGTRGHWKITDEI